VLAVVELKARFDEEANINWAERLEAVGAQVVYGIVGLKTHAKLLLVTRRERCPPGLLRYAHLSTGNYNPKTARLYTDVGYLTADPDLTADADAVFQQLASLNQAAPAAAPAGGALQRCTAPGWPTDRPGGPPPRAGRPARIVAKFNALTDPSMIDAVVRPPPGRRQIDLIVRGACMLPPGVPGVSDRIRVRSVVGRFLEHTRVLYFRWGERRADEALYLSSAPTG
jgi:polyphosphate kinase